MINNFPKNEDECVSTVLIVDDELISRNSVIALLGKEGYRLLEAKSGIEALELIELEIIDLMLLDVMMPEMNGYEVCRRVRSTPQFSGMPIVMVTALHDHDSRIKGLASGADDFLTKPFDSTELRTRVRSITRLNRYRRLLMQEERLSYLEDYDEVTNLPNRRLLESRLIQAIARSERIQLGVVVMMIELDNFDKLEDGLGREGCDEILKETGTRLLRAVRPRDTISRIADCRFVILLESLTPTHDFTALAQRSRIAFETTMRAGIRDISISISMGISLFPADGDSARTILHNANLAMNRAKHKGGNSFEFFSLNMNKEAKKRLELENDLRKAIKDESFILHYQPKVSVSDRKIVGVEALIRWEHPILGIVPPNEFIPLAEETGLIIPLGEWALRTACLQTKEWENSDLSAQSLSMAVNVSSIQFNLPGFHKIVSRVISETEVNPKLIELELTESLLLPDPRSANHTMRTMQFLKDLGINLAIDDFGTGFSSLSYLHRYPIDILKIDKSFIDDIETNKEHSILTQSIIQLGKNLGFTVVAEGVETKTQYSFLKQKDCDQIQGYLFSKPLPKEQIQALFSTGLTIDI